MCLRVAFSCCSYSRYVLRYVGVAGHVWQLHKSDFSNGESHGEGVLGFIGHFSTEIIPVDLSQGEVEM